MKIVRYLDVKGRIGYGSEQSDGSVRVIEGDILTDFQVTREKAHTKKRLAPIVPTMLWCIGLNYKFHAQEANLKIPNYPVLFAKGPNTVQNPDDPIQIPTHLRSDEVDYECELAVVIGKNCKNVSKEQAYDYIFGYTCANDVSARDWQLERGGSQWCRGKTFDTFAPLGPCIVTKEDIPDPHALRIQTVLNGETLQDWKTDDMIFNIPTIIEFLSGSTTLSPGTVILTGTPQGVGMARKPPVFLKAGDKVSVVIEKIGTLANPVEDERT